MRWFWNLAYLLLRPLMIVGNWVERHREAGEELLPLPGHRFGTDQDRAWAAHLWHGRYRVVEGDPEDFKRLFTPKPNPYLPQH